MSGGMPSNRAVDPKQRMRIWRGLVLNVELACEEFRVLQEIIINNIIIENKDNQFDFRSRDTVCLALARSFLFSVRRIERINDGGKNFLPIPRVLRKEISTALKPFIAVRDVNEHGYDPNKLDGDKTTPKMHVSATGEGLIDETSLFIDSSETVLMGPVNLYNAYVAIKNLNAVANFKTLSMCDVQDDTENK